MKYLVLIIFISIEFCSFAKTNSHHDLSTSNTQITSESPSLPAKNYDKIEHFSGSKTINEDINRISGSIVVKGSGTILTLNGTVNYCKGIDVLEGATIIINGDFETIDGNIKVGENSTLIINADINQINDHILIEKDATLQLNNSSITLSGNSNYILIKPEAKLEMENQSKIDVEDYIENEGEIVHDFTGNRIFGKFKKGDPELFFDNIHEGGIIDNVFRYTIDENACLGQTVSITVFITDDISSADKNSISITSMSIKQNNQTIATVNDFNMPINIVITSITDTNPLFLIIGGTITTKKKKKTKKKQFNQEIPLTDLIINASVQTNPIIKL
ncbi:hypothetical protein EYV94_00015 [Puteibacter caeruleilacunae]|nr:hypothetical protein EYV94_00015 [Puteibacter caeruleilacunae]